MPVPFSQVPQVLLDSFWASGNMLQEADSKHYGMGWKDISMISTFTNKAKQCKVRESLRVTRLAVNIAPAVLARYVSPFSLLGISR